MILKVIQKKMYRNSLIVLSIVLMQSCASKKDILYFQDAKNYNVENISYQNSKIQPNDILNIVVDSPIPEAAIPYNIKSLGGAVNFDLEALKLQGYLVSQEGGIDFPVLGKLLLGGMIIEDAEKEIERLLAEGGHLKDASVNIRLINAKVTILGEVIRPGTYGFTEQNITLPQALGYAGDLTITGKREDILFIREENGVRTINHIDLTSADWFSGPFYYIKPNDIIIVNPNNTKVKSAGFIGNAGIVLTIASLLLSSIVLISR
ncbi:polysaccharide biosynthesis/export family protein [Aquimarina pacifica]|uniref:polysaccharide biosynthesis/export family protein n=1 Tax=Aquimarina pacifica TaxID=1296415 RepID=UPI001F4CD546|nr:polysaccharide biosynthesis/export family protein [Aquimarina pacifica]